MDALDRFRLRVLDDPALRAQLLAEEDPHRFAIRVVALAHVEGIDIAIDDVRRGLADARDGRFVRWI